MKLPSVKDLPIFGKRVLLRTNYDVPLRLSLPRAESRGSGQALQVADATRIEKSLPTINYLLEQKAKVIVISHLGRPGGKVIPELSLRPVAKLISNFKFQISNQFQMTNVKLGDFDGWQLSNNLWILENLRFYPEEENPSTSSGQEFAKKLASLADFYVNEAFACSHRRHASIVGVPKLFPATRRSFGFDFLKEIEILTKVREQPKRPVVLLLGGVKKDKIEYAKKLVYWADWILIGGRLVEHDGVPELLDHHKIIGSLIKDGQDITMETVKEFGGIITKAKTIVWAGPMGNFYNEEYEEGTRRIAEAVVKSGAFTVVGGGDTEAALTKFGLTDKVGFISSGGGAMLGFLAEGTLPGIEAVKHGKSCY